MFLNAQIPRHTHRAIKSQEWVTKEGYKVRVRVGGLLTSQVPDKVLQHHLTIWLDVGAVHVGVEEDDGKGQDEDGVRVVELLHHLGVAHAVALAGETHVQRRR